ncbi:helix-turn-helix domain-containing protein [Spirosoma montaniterrae]|uniref:XRE family transcriptional regulator n=1 Tax=Spirosoma montaniterrae TaxID=1178516 RepID=A0A1P9WTK2_9BACT|nr:helix-turn-helix transcriptional regulator [Spirosoma montaniterrae]AQG78711.1 XRE family transcriptional regulator [Spirosoma montaniterrae]
MDLNSGNIRLLFGLKLRQMRLDKSLTQLELAERAGLSQSYINEIEKGKKYPKTEKIIALAKAMDTTYDVLVSLQLNKKMEPIYQLLRSDLLTDLPLGMFGIEPGDLLELLSEAPIKLSAFISTVVEMARSHNVTLPQFYFTVMRTYQELHDNYFPDIEDAADAFLAESGLPAGELVSDAFLSEYLTTHYGYEIVLFTEETFPTLTRLRSAFIPDEKLLLLNQRLTTDQRVFTLGRELAFQYMNLTARPLTSTWVEVDTFEQVLNNFRASYFAGAILIRREALRQQLETLLNLTTWAEASTMFMALLDQFQATPETLLLRMSNLLPRFFGIDEFVFLRLEQENNSPVVNLTREIHLSRLHNPHGTTDEHYCRRWVALTSLQELEEKLKQNTYTEPLLRAQLSDYIGSQNTYLILSFTRPLTPIKYLNHSVLLGILVNDASRSRIRFLDDPAIQHREVNESCERCPLTDCRERVAPPTELKRQQRMAAIKQTLKSLGV